MSNCESRQARDQRREQERIAEFCRTARICEGREETALRRVSTQAEWHFNAVTGRDTNSGLTADQSLKTWAEYVRRLGDWGHIDPVGGRVAWFIHSDLPDSDPIGLPNGAIFARGASALMEVDTIPDTENTIAAIVNVNPDLNQAYEITVATGAPDFWATHIGERAVLTSGPAIGSVFYASKDLGAQTARVSDFGLSGGTADAGAEDISNPPLPGDTFLLERLHTMTWGVWAVISGGWDSDPSSITIDKAALQTPTGIFINVPPGVSVDFSFTFRECIFVSEIDVGGSASILHCVAQQFVGAGGAGSIFYRMGLHFGDFGCDVSAKLQADTGGYTLLQGGGFTPQGTVFVDGDPQLAIFDVDGHTFNIAGGIDGAQVNVIFSSTDPIWGNGSAQGGYLSPHSILRFLMLSDKFPTVSSAQDPVAFNMNAFVSSDFGQSHPWDRNTITPEGPGPKYLSKRTMSWANLNVPIAAGGFQTDDYFDSGFEFKSANAVDPGQLASLSYDIIIFPP